uniref:Reverse transcriptase zinc-binding domain-containing protein n=1 Tax=Podarcis muralis TaxID=64176 RepID=A0A670IVE2_PODMU
MLLMACLLYARIVGMLSSIKKFILLVWEPHRHGLFEATLLWPQVYSRTNKGTIVPMLFVLPKMLFLFQTLQIVDKTECFRKWQRDISKFVWQGKKPRIKFKILTDAKERGGFALPDLRLYYESAAFCWLKDWLLLEDTDVLDLEGFNNAFGWHAYLWYDKVKINKVFKNHIVRKAVFNVWTKYKDLLENKTPRWLSPLEAKARKRSNMEANWPKYWEILEKDGDNWKLQSMEKMRDKVRDWLHYAQIKEVFKLDKKLGFQVEKSKLETELLEPKTKVLSRMYNLLLKWNTQDETVKSAMIKWAQDIGHNIMFEDWERLWTTGLNFTACNALKENVMKMIYRWYMTPVKLAKIYHLSDNKCWKCKENEGTFFHLWWTCPKVKAFWEKIYNELKKVFKYTFSKKPEAFLLGMVGQGVVKKDRTFFMYATTAAKDTSREALENTRSTHTGRMADATDGLYATGRDDRQNPRSGRGDGRRRLEKI